MKKQVGSSYKIETDASTRISDRIVEQLLDRIYIDKLRIDDPLPSERDLMRQFGVSRVACREAVAKLQGMGVVQSRYGKGVYVADTSQLLVSPILLRLLQSHGDVSSTNVLEARLLIEPGMANMAAIHAKQGQRSALMAQARKALPDFEALSLVEHAEQFAKADVAFHQLIATSTGNPILPHLLRSIHELLLRVRLEVIILRPTIIRRALSDHRAIATAIVNGDGDAAQAAMERHIRLRGKELLKEYASDR